MGHFARVKDGIVQEVIVAEQPDIDSGLHGDASEWIQTSYNGSFRKNYAGFGYIYDLDKDEFNPPPPATE